ncbi:hypothetical protein LSH36_660g00010 [Paralvinella palmiformis]|uniref:Uncharacterized protein n=1 Tax=Paralvinella palmiformis TaxID=53620 RepID=A0AAD9J3K2_9ANNE|nr:hypothetical protein LSH36_660g00010 [Paralvinella palmiformis]
MKLSLSQKTPHRTGPADMMGFCSIQRAIQENDARRLAKLLGQRVKLRLTAEDLAMALMESISQGKAECVPALLAARADPNCVDEDGKTPLIVCMDSKAGGSPAIIRDLLQAGASPNKVTSTSHQTALHLAARKGYQVAVKILLAHRARPDKEDSLGNTPLTYAAREGHFTALKMILEAGASPDPNNKQLETPLMMTARSGHLDCAEELLECGADPDGRDAKGQTPLMLALRGGHMDMVELLMSYKCDMNSQNTESGKTVLHWAVQSGDVNLVHAVLRMGAEPNIRDKQWETPFVSALLAKRLDIVELLMKYNCDVTVTDKHFNTGLHLAAREGLPDLVPMFLEAGLDCNLKTSAGQTPLMLAAFGGHVDIVSSLLTRGANPEAMDRHRATALVYGIVSLASDDAVNRIVKLLIRTGCSLDQGINLQRLLADNRLNKDDKRVKNLQQRPYTPLEIAFLRGRPIPFMMLLRSGCSLKEFALDTLKHGHDWLSAKRTDFRTVLYLLKHVKVAKKQFPSLQQLCRRPAVLVYRNPGFQQRTKRMDLKKEVRDYLNFEELDSLEKTFLKAIAPSKDNNRWGSAGGQTIKSDSSPFSRLSNARATYTLGSTTRRHTTSNASYRSVRSSESSEEDDVFRRVEMFQNRSRRSTRSPLPEQVSSIYGGGGRTGSGSSNGSVDFAQSGTENWVMTHGRTTDPPQLRGVVKVPVRSAVNGTARGSPLVGRKPRTPTAGRLRIGRQHVTSPRSPPTLESMLFVTPPAGDVVHHLGLDRMTNRDSVISTDTGFQSEDMQRPESPTEKDLQDLKSAIMWKNFTTPIDAWDSESIDSAGVVSATGSLDSRDTDLSDFSRGSTTTANDVIGGRPSASKRHDVVSPASSTSTAAASRKSRIPVFRKSKRAEQSFNNKNGVQLSSQFVYTDDDDDDSPAMFRRTQSCRKY